MIEDRVDMTDDDALYIRSLAVANRLPPHASENQRLGDAEDEHLAHDCENAQLHVRIVFIFAKGRGDQPRAEPVCFADEAEWSVQLVEGVCSGKIGFEPRGEAGREPRQEDFQARMTRMARILRNCKERA